MASSRVRENSHEGRLLNYIHHDAHKYVLYRSIRGDELKKSTPLLIYISAGLGVSKVFMTVMWWR